MKSNFLKKRGAIRNGAVAGIVAALLTFSAAAPALAWGTKSFGPPTGCTGSATAFSISGASGKKVAHTDERGNWCPFGRHQVFVGIISSGGGYAVSEWNWDQAAVSTYAGAVGAYHQWGNTSTTT